MAPAPKAAPVIDLAAARERQRQRARSSSRMPLLVWISWIVWVPLPAR